MRARLLGTLIAAVAASLSLGVGIASAQGLEGSGDASVQQYDNRDSQQVLGEVEQVQEEPATEAQPAAAVTPTAQPSAPQQAAEGELPFTGLATAGLALLGLALLGGGLVLRHAAREQRQH